MAFPPHHHQQQHGFMFHSHEENGHLPSPNSSLPSHLHSCPPHLFPGGGGRPFMMKRSMSFSGVEKFEKEAMNNNVGDDDLSDDGSQIGERKKRLNLEQVKALEKSFELGTKLELDRKMQLAKGLGLQPRQIAIWFQNRRARWKTKQLERDYEVLKKQFDSIKADNDTLQAQNKKLHAELTALKGRDYPNDEVVNLKKETNNDQGSWSNGRDNSCDVNLDIPRKTQVATSPVSSQMGIKHLFSTNPNTTTRPITSMTQFLQSGSTRSNLHSLKVNDHQEENLICNMFNGVEDDQQQGLWPWADQHPAAFSLNQTQFSNN